VKNSIIFFVVALLFSSTSAFALPPVVSAPANENVCPAGFQCCPDLSHAQTVDLTAWQLTGQPMPNNEFNMVWWTQIGKVGYVTCYYNVYHGNPFTLESIVSIQKPADNNKVWKKSNMEGTLICTSNNIGVCSFLENK
jgi:hypothetical protein